jgi:hypothetical protein
MTLIKKREEDVYKLLINIKIFFKEVDFTAVMVIFVHVIDKKN